MALTEKQDLEDHSSKAHQRHKHKIERQSVKKQLQDNENPTDSYGKYRGGFA